MQNMGLKKSFAFGTMMLLIVVCIIPSINADIFKLNVCDSSGSILYVGGSGPGNYSKIQDAIDFASDGDTVFVYNDSSPYLEHVEINKSIKLRGEDRSSTIVDGAGEISVISVVADEVSISGFTIKNSSSDGIYVNGSDHIDITGNIISNNERNGILLKYSSGNNVIHNVIGSNDNAGIVLAVSSSNSISHNNFLDNDVHALFATFCFSNRWNENYWDDWSGRGPKIIPGVLFGITFHLVIPWVNFDWQPMDGADENPIAIMDTNMGAMTLVLYEDKVPVTTDNFIRLSNDGFYEGIVFHRVIDDFVIQGGGFDTSGTQKQSPYGPIDLEIHPDVRHVDGAISMARTSDPNSATSQFFICDGKQPHLDDSYAAFGKVIAGLDVLRDIASVETTMKHGMQDWPIDEVVINDIIIID